MVDKTAEELANEIKASHAELSKVHDKKVDEVKAIAEQAVVEAKKGTELSNSMKEKADLLLTDVNGLKSQLTEIEQKMARQTTWGSHGADDRKTLGELVIESEDVKSRLLGGPKKGSVNLSLETKAIVSGSGSWGSTASVTSSLVVADRQPLIPLPMRRMTVRDLLAPGQTISNNIEYAVQVARTNAAAMVVEGTAKPYSNYTWDLRNAPVKTLAHLVKASRQILDDAPALRSTIDAEMNYGLEFAEEAQFLYGDGTGANLLGIVPQAAAYSAAFAITGETAIDRIRMAMLQGVLALYPMTGTVLNPTDWAKISLTKNAQGNYIIGDPQGTVTPRLWGLPVVESLAMTAGTYLTGAFKYGAQVFDRMSVEILISTENVDDLEKNLVTIRAEERLSLVVRRPTAFVTGTLP
jgi:HK97 family phage major capsid protein